MKERLEASEYAGEIPVSGGTGQEPVRQSAGNVADATPVSAESGLVSELSAETALPAPMTTNAYENARRLTIREISRHSRVFVRIQGKRPAIWII